jgi:asparagine synthase (glutamine-hydrolysing)
VLEYAFSLPLDYRVRGNQKKIILRSLLSRYLPRELFERPKQGFTAPMRSWFANELREELHDRLAPARVKRLEIFDPDVVQRAIVEQQQGSADHTLLLWALLLLDRWYEQRIEGR